MEPVLNSLIDKYLQGCANAEERAQVERYYQSLLISAPYTQGLSPQHKKDLEEKLLTGILQQIQPAQSPVLKRFREPGLYGRVAAAVITLMLITWVAQFYSKPNNVVLTTTKGQVATFSLPDQSTVTLNGNSRLVYTPWNNREDRQVSLQGEAFFSVTHTINHQKFLVNLPDQVQVEVLGTEFNVSSRQNKSRVVLNSGKVRLRLPATRQEIEMQPGEMVEVAPKANKVAKRKVNAAQYSSWSKSLLVLDKTKLSELVQILETTYGLHVSVADSSLLDHTFSGRLPQQDADILLLGLSKAFDFKITRNGSSVIIDKQ